MTGEKTSEGLIKGSWWAHDQNQFSYSVSYSFLLVVTNPFFNQFQNQ